MGGAWVQSGSGSSVCLLATFMATYIAAVTLYIAAVTLYINVVALHNAAVTL